jgi:hypothetical protein
MDTCLRRYDNKLSHYCAGRSLYLGLVPRVSHLPPNGIRCAHVDTCLRRYDSQLTRRSGVGRPPPLRRQGGLAFASPLSRPASSCFQALSPRRLSDPAYSLQTIPAATTGGYLSTIARFCEYPIQRSLLAPNPSRAESCWHQSRSGHRDRAGL